MQLQLEWHFDLRVILVEARPGASTGGALPPGGRPHVSPLGPHMIPAPAWPPVRDRNSMADGPWNGGSFPLRVPVQRQTRQQPFSGGV